MLTRRTNVLLTEEDYLTLSRLTKLNKKTIGELIRHAIRKAYPVKTKKSKIDRDLMAAIKKSWKAVNHPEIPIDYKALIEDGRKY